MHTTYNLEIEKLYQNMRPLLLNCAKAALQSDTLAEEAVQDTFKIACQKADSLCASSNPEGWLMNTLKNVIANAIRRSNTSQRFMAELLELKETGAATLADHLSPDVLYGDISQTDEFKLLKQIALDGMTYPELAEERGISVTTCRKRIQRAKESLRKKIKQD